MSPMGRALHERFEEICRAELVRLRRKHRSLSPTHQAELDVISLAIARAIAARLTDALDDDQVPDACSIVGHLFALTAPNNLGSGRECNDRVGGCA